MLLGESQYIGQKNHPDSKYDNLTRTLRRGIFHINSLTLKEIHAV